MDGRTEHQARNVAYAQRRTEDTGVDAGAFDLVTSTVLLHEMPPAAVERPTAETDRPLPPGGVVVHLDFRAGDGPFDGVVHYGHTRRNNEPSMRPRDEMGLVRARQAAGFKDVAINHRSASWTDRGADGRRSRSSIECAKPVQHDAEQIDRHALVVALPGVVGGSQAHVDPAHVVVAHDVTLARGLSTELSYRLLGTTEAELTAADGVTQIDANYRSHTVLVMLKYAFGAR